MGITYQPQTLPEPDGNGRLVLTEKKSNIFGMVLVIVSICLIGLMCAAYWYQLYADALPSGLSAYQIKLGAALGLASPLALPYCFKWLMNPPSLVIDDDGIELRKPGQTRRIAWQGVREIKTDVIRDTSVNPVNSTGTFGPHTVTVVRGQSNGIVLNSDFGLTATALTAYLIQRQNGAPGSRIRLVDVNAVSAQKVETRGRLLNRVQMVVFLIVLLVVGAFLMFLLWARLTLF